MRGRVYIHGMKSVKEMLRYRELELHQHVQRVIDAACLTYNQDYMRIDTGANVKSGMASSKIGSGKIRYTMPYSRYDYYPTRYNHGIGTARGALRGDYHFPRMVQARGKQILEAAARAAGGKAV